MSTTIEPTVKVRSLSHLAVYVRDLDISHDFYAKVLGFAITLDEREHSRHPRIFGTIGPVTVELMKCRSEPDGPQPPPQLGLAGMAFRVDDLEAACAALHEAGHTKLKSPKSIGRLKMLFAQDPDGSFFELVEYLPGYDSLAEAIVEN